MKATFFKRGLQKVMGLLVSVLELLTHLRNVLECRLQGLQTLILL